MRVHSLLALGRGLIWAGAPVCHRESAAVAMDRCIRTGNLLRCRWQ
ncbi:MAG: hypothetical protein ABFC84_15100 [Veillonellales bacterium]